MSVATTASDSIRVFLVEGEPATSNGLLRGLEQAGVAVAGRAEDTPSAVRELPDKPVDVVLLHTSNGNDRIGDVSRAAAGSAVIAVSDTSDPNEIVGLLAAGAHAYLINDEGVEETAAAVARAVAHGETLVSPRMRKLVMARLRELEASGPPDPLTERELDVLRSLSDGLDASGVAASLGQSIGAVRDDIASIRTKLGVEPTRRFVR